MSHFAVYFVIVIQSLIARSTCLFTGWFDWPCYSLIEAGDEMTVEDGRLDECS